MSPAGAMKIGDWSSDESVLVIAEIGNNHEGSAAVAEEMLRSAAASGADAVKFQTFKTEHYVSIEQTERFAKLQSFELSFQEFEGLKAAANEEGVMFLSTPFDLHSARFLDDLVPAFKIASGDNTFYPLIDAITDCGKPLLLSSGHIDLVGIENTCNRIRDRWAAASLDPGLAVLHCVGAYPTPLAEANLGAIRALETRLACTVGYSDHTVGIDAAALAVACGARILEKHFTLDKSYSDFPDHRISADPADMKALVERVRHAETLLGSGTKAVQPSEAPSIEAVRRSLVAARALDAGDVLRQGDVTWVRPSGGLAPGEETAVLGCKLRRAVAAGERISADMVEQDA